MKDDYAIWESRACDHQLVQDKACHHCKCVLDSRIISNSYIYIYTYSICIRCTICTVAQCFHFLKVQSHFPHYVVGETHGSLSYQYEVWPILKIVYDTWDSTLCVKNQRRNGEKYPRTQRKMAVSAMPGCPWWKTYIHQAPGQQWQCMSTKLSKWIICSHAGSCRCTLYLLFICVSVPMGRGSALHGSSYPLVYECACEWVNERPI